MIDLEVLLDESTCSAELAGRGGGPGTAADQAALFRRAAACLAESGSSSSRGVGVLALWVPGRIEVLGKHTDYAGGRSLVSATEQGFALVARKRPDLTLVIRDARSRASATLAISPDLEPTLGSWTNYPATVVRRLARNFGLVRGADVSFASNLPPAAGLSSSSAMICGFALALMCLNETFGTEAYRRNISCLEDLAGYLGTNENGQTFGDLAGDKGVGTFGGSEDHTAIICGREGMLSRYSYAPVRLEGRVPWPSGQSFVVGSSGIVAEKTGAARDLYNRAAWLAGEAAEIWRRATGRRDRHLAEAIASCTPEEVRHVVAGAGAGSEIVERLDHFVEESDTIIPEACAALEAGDLDAFGKWVARSQAMGVARLRNQTDETAFLAESARGLGAVAASAFGAGFGGSVWAMVPTEASPEFAEAWRQGYANAFPGPARQSEFFVSSPGSSAFALGPDISPWVT